MAKLFGFHIDKKQMDVEIMERSLNIYLNQFDPSHAYMTENEASPYTKPSAELIAVMQEEYSNDQFSTYFALNKAIQASVYRAREWRREWHSDSSTLVSEAQLVEFSEKPIKTFAKSQAELQERHRDRYVRFIAFQMEALDSACYKGKEEKVVALCEKQICAMENSYLGLDDLGAPLSEKQQTHQIVLRTLKSLANSLDAHTAYYSPEEAFAMKTQLEKGMCGIGVVLREGVEGVTIHELVKGGPAEKCGKIRSGDTIIEVDGRAVDQVSFKTLLEIMRGKEGTKTELTLVRYEGTQPQRLRVPLVRSKITLDDKRVDYEAEPYGDGVIGKITLHSFYEGGNGVTSEQDIKAALAELRKQGPLYGLVFDMRENTGGFLSQAIKVSGLFISNGVVVISKYSDGSIKYYRVVDGLREYDGPLVILTSKGSASAAEIVAQTLRDYGVGIVAGDDRTYGKGTIQHQTITGGRSGDFFKVTIGRYYTVSGASTQIDGVKSDIIVPSPFQYEELGEGHLDYPLPADRVAPAYNDTLADIDPFARRWFQKFYVPHIQKQNRQWSGMIPILKENSRVRLAQNPEFQSYLQAIQAKDRSPLPEEIKKTDLQMEESVNIVKDMIFLAH